MGDSESATTTGDEGSRLDNPPSTNGTTIGPGPIPPPKLTRRTRARAERPPWLALVCVCRYGRRCTYNRASASASAAAAADAPLSRLTVPSLTLLTTTARFSILSPSLSEFFFFF